VPLYEYSCQQCQHAFETLVRDGEEVECPRCRSQNLERQWSVPARPQSAGASLPMGCDPSLPPCGPACRRFQG